MEQSIHKSRWAPVILFTLLFLILAIYDSRFYARNYFILVRDLWDFNYFPIMMYEWCTLVTCIEGIIIVAALLCASFNRKIVSIALSCISILVAMLPCAISQIFNVYSGVVALISTCVIAYGLTKAKDIWKKAPRLFYIVGGISILVTFVLSFYKVTISESEFVLNAWENFGKPAPVYQRSGYPSWWNIQSYVQG